MTPPTLGMLHPGAMGISVAATATASGCAVGWCSDGRSVATADRAAAHELIDFGTVDRMAARADVILSVCPPHAAESVATEVAAAGFDGHFVDANAISPTRTRCVASIVESSGARFVDGGIIGGPAWAPEETWLYLSGEDAPGIVPIFDAGPLGVRVLSAAVGDASALKMCYAAYTKGSTALLCAILSTASELGVRPALEQQWREDGGGLDESVRRRATRVTAKAWRYVGEMEEIAETFRSVGATGAFHDGAAEVYRRLASFKDAHATPDLERVLEALRGDGSGVAIDRPHDAPDPAERRP